MEWSSDQPTANCLLRGLWRSHLETVHEWEYSFPSIHAILTKLMLCFLSVQISPLVIHWSAENMWHKHLSATCSWQAASHNLFSAMHMNVAPNSVWYMSFPQGLAGVPGQPGEPGKEGKRVSKHKQSPNSCEAWLVVLLTVRTWPRERPNSSWVAVVVLGGIGDDLWTPWERRGGVGLLCDN